jgi:hypothetical protein
MPGFKGRVGEAELERWRGLDCAVLLPRLAEHVKSDVSFTPIKNGHTHRWHLQAGGREFELLTTGPKWFDSRQQRGGGGAIDLTIHLLRLDFKQAVAKLREIL